MEHAINAIEIRGLSKRYETFQMDDVNLSLPTGYIMGVIGENGAGKTTLIKAMMGLIRPDAGKISLLGDPVEESDPACKEHIGVVLDACSFPEEMNLGNIRSVMASCYRTWDNRKFDRYVKQFNLPEKQKIKKYSKGMKMKLSIATALSHDSKLLVLDEATAGLDPVVREELLEIFQDFIQDESHSILLSSHILSDLEKICDYITFMHEGKILFSESRETLMEQYGIIKCTKEQLEAVDPEAVIAVRENRFGVEALVKRALMNEVFAVEDASIEDIMVYYIRESGGSRSDEEPSDRECMGKEGQ